MMSNLHLPSFFFKKESFINALLQMKIAPFKSLKKIELKQNLTFFRQASAKSSSWSSTVLGKFFESAIVKIYI